MTARTSGWQWTGAAFLAACGLFAVAALWVATLDMGPDGAMLRYSVQVEARDGRLLRSFQTEDDRWRLPLSAKDVDPLYLRMLLAYEDQRFGSHYGVDPLAMMRASGQMLLHGRVVSGGSTLSMQVARLLSPTSSTRSLERKMLEAGRAIRLQAALGRARLLDLYLSIAPFGGNIEGVRQASLFYFGKEPKRLSPGEAALLVALPQSPETRRPDRFPETARAARDRVLHRLVKAGVLSDDVAEAGLNEPVPTARRPALALAWHETEEAVRQAPHRQSIRVTLDRSLQESLEALLRERVRPMAPAMTAALIVIDHTAGDIIARIGNADPLAQSRAGAIDMTRAIRSPGSALKPFIYAMAFESGLVHPETLVEDRPIRFGSWGPTNFDMTYQGTVSARTALQLSLNVPAVQMLDLVGPQRLISRFREIGAETHLPSGEVPGLAIGLGGIGIRPIDLARLYAALARGGDAVMLRSHMDEAALRSPQRAFGVASAWYVADTLRLAPAPDGHMTGRIAYKTGTSYGYRDAWAAGFDGQHTIVVWVGRADGAAIPGLTGRGAAAPLLFEAFQRLGRIKPFGPAPADAVMASNASLAPHLKRFGQKAGEPTRPQDHLRIASPADGVRLDLGYSRNTPETLIAKVNGGTPPYLWLLNGRPVTPQLRERLAELPATGPGSHALTVVDGEGRTHSVSVRIE